MSSLNIKVVVSGGTMLEQAIKDAIELRKITSANVAFDFNGVPIYIWRDDQQVDELVNKYNEYRRKPMGIVA